MFIGRDSIVATSPLKNNDNDSKTNNPYNLVPSPNVPAEGM